ncbi:MAG: LytR/AlgR family response regulator transcription factor [Lewinella sp.]|uniref:LytR/AlgR family response regulator transcription factor n=1 Tax=Lewinella sp. TaxID=2004506 RepID=UPI003D6A1742
MTKNSHPLTIVDRYRQFLLKPFPYLDGWKSRLFLVLFSSGFSVVFIYFFNPFNIRSIDYEGALLHFIPIELVSLSGALTLGITQFYLREKLGFDRLNVGRFLGWFCLEAFLICIVVYVLFGVWEKPFFTEFSIIIDYSLSLSILPYLVACLLILVVKLSKTEAQQKQQPAMANMPLLFRDKNGKGVLSLRTEQILFLKSENNYVAIHHVQEGQLKCSLIRNNLKEVTNALAGTNFLRVHRSYTVNLNQIVSAQRKKDGYLLHLAGLTAKKLKVSETYRSVFEEKYLNR